MKKYTYLNGKQIDNMILQKKCAACKNTFELGKGYRHFTRICSEKCLIKINEGDK